MKTFKDLYRFSDRLMQRRAANGQRPAYDEDVLRYWLQREQPGLKITFYDVPPQKHDPLGYFIRRGQQVDIHAQEGLADVERRFVRIKEMMHCLDAPDGLVAESPAFRILLNDMSFRPLERHTVSQSEQIARWRAILVCIPLDFRDHAVTDWQSDQRDIRTLEQTFAIPEHAVRAALSQLYNQAHGLLIDA